LDKFLISVVIAAKDAPAELIELCLASFSALANAHRLQLVIVQSGSIPTLKQDMMNRFADVKVIEVLPEGVYSAYNNGIKSCEGTYVLFFGIDDIVLPGMDSVIDQLNATLLPFHLFAASCYMQSIGVSEPSHRRTSLVFRNWCHQGIFYLRNYLLSHPYQTEYKAQADHKMNIDIVSNHSLRFGVSKELVAYFSAGGVSSLSPDLRFRKDFPALVARAYGKHYGFLVKIKQLIIDALLGDPKRRFAARLRR
jgi:glycosyltransferase involved in cell wall biosynthesis